MLTTMADILNYANERNFAVMAVNSCSMETVQATIQAAVREDSPVIINISPRQMKLMIDPESFMPGVVALAKSVDVPVALNLDHGMKREDIMRAMKLGFTSVMFDGSALPYERNRDITRYMVSVAHGMGITVEAELGHVGQAADGDGRTDDMYTKVEDAVRFIEETGVDCLAVAVGTAHGTYPEGFVPTLDFDRLKAIKEATGAPLVLHGGSGSGEENIKRAVACGINKINVCSDVFAVGRDHLRDALAENPRCDYMTLMKGAQAAMADYVASYMRLIGSAGKAHFDIEDTSKE